MKENIWIPEEVTECWSKNAQQGTPKYVHFMYVEVSKTMGKNCPEMTSWNTFTYTEEYY